MAERESLRYVVQLWYKGGTIAEPHWHWMDYAKPCLTLTEVGSVIHEVKGRTTHNAWKGKWRLITRKTEVSEVAVEGYGDEGES